MVKDSTGALQGSKQRVYYRTIEDETSYELQKSGVYITERTRYNLQKAMRITETEQRQNQCVITTSDVDYRNR